MGFQLVAYDFDFGHFGHSLNILSNLLIFSTEKIHSVLQNVQLLLAKPKTAAFAGLCSVYKRLKILAFPKKVGASRLPPRWSLS
jgi:hypothetical protein